MRKYTLVCFIVLMCISLLPAACRQNSNADVQKVDKQAAGPGELVVAGTMAHARAAHTATVLTDGRVLLVGGFTGEENADDGVEIYDPATGTFTPTGKMITLRHSHTASLLADGRVLITGGYDDQRAYLNSAEIYNPSTGTFVDAGTMTGTRADHVAVTLSDGRILLVGGVGTGWTFLASAEIYDPETGTFTPTGSMSVPRESHAPVLLKDGRVYVVGGHSGRRAAIQIYTSAEIYDPDTGVFRPAGEMTIRRHKHDALLLPDGRVLITGGTDERDNNGVYGHTEIYDPSTGTYTSAGEMRMPRYKHRGTSQLLPDGRVLLASGATQAEIYDPATGVFHLVEGEARMAGQFAATSLLPDGRVLITGGYGGNRGARDGTWLYQP